MRFSSILLFAGELVIFSHSVQPEPGTSVKERREIFQARGRFSVRNMRNLSKTAIRDDLCSPDLRQKVMKLLSPNTNRVFIPENEKALDACLITGFQERSVEELMLASAHGTLDALRTFLQEDEDLVLVGPSWKSTHRSLVEVEIETLWGKVMASSDSLNRFVNMPHEPALRYILGAREATRLILTAQPVSGLDILYEATDSARTKRLLAPLVELLDSPISKLIRLHEKYIAEEPSKNMSLDDSLMRPKNKPLMAFLVGAERAEYLAERYVTFLREYLLEQLPPSNEGVLNNVAQSMSQAKESISDAISQAKGLSMPQINQAVRGSFSGIVSQAKSFSVTRAAVAIAQSSPRGLGTQRRSSLINEDARLIEAILSQHLSEFTQMYDVVSIDNLDVLAAALGSEKRAYEMVSEKAWNWILNLRSACDEARQNDRLHSCPIVETTALWMPHPHQDLVDRIKRFIIDRLDFYPTIFSAGFDNLSFLIGPIHSAVLSRDGIHTELKFLSETERDENNKRKVIYTTTSFKALRPSGSRVMEVFGNVLSQELDRTQENVPLVAWT